MSSRLFAFAIAACAACLAAAQPTARVNLGPGGAQGNSWDDAMAVSADGRHVVFASRSTNLIPGGTTGRQLFASDRDPDGNGVYDEGNTVVTLMSRGFDGFEGNGTQGGFNGHYGVDCSADGRFILWQSQSTNLIPGDTTGWPHYDVFVRDRDPDGNGVFDEGNGVNERVNTAHDGSEANNSSNGTDTQISISADGRYVVFASWSSNLIPGGPTDGNGHVYLHDRQTGQRSYLDAGTTTINGGAWGPHISADASTIVYFANNDPFFGSNWDQVYAVASDGLSPVLISKDDLGNEGNANSERQSYAYYGPRTNANGRFIVFVSLATNLDITRPNDQPGMLKLYLHDRDADENGVYDEPGGWATRRLDVGPGGVGGSAWPHYGDISDDGSRIAFLSFAGNLVAGDATPGSDGGDVFLYERLAGTLELVSRATDGTQGNPSCWASRLSGDGGTVIFDSTANNLVPGDTNNRDDVFARTLPPAPCNTADLAVPFGLLDLADVNAFVTGFLAGDPIADLNSDGLHDLADVLAFSTTFLAGCP